MTLFLHPLFLQTTVPPLTATTAVLSVASDSSNNIKSDRNWSNRRRPYLKQQPATRAKSASVQASQKISELSSAKLELVKLRLLVEQENRDRAVQEHEQKLRLMREEHDLKMQVLRAKLQSITSEQ